MPDGGRPGPSVQSPDGPRTRKRIRERRHRIGTTIPLLCLLFCMDCSDLLVLPRLSQYYTAVQIANRHWKQAFHSAELQYRSSGTGILSTVHIMDEQHPAGGKPIPEKRQCSCRRGIQICINGNKCKCFLRTAVKSLREISLMDNCFFRIRQAQQSKRPPC